MRVANSDRPSVDLGQRVRTLRFRAGLTIKQVALKSRISPSSISKIENNQLSPTYETIVGLAQGLSVDISELFSDETSPFPRGRRTITKSSMGKLFKSENYDYEMLCSDLTQKKMIPLKATIKAHEIKDFSKMITHDGEELILILSGEIILHTEFYEPALLTVGDCVYFDSTMGHVCVAHGSRDAEVFWVCSSSEVVDLVSSAR